MAPRNTAGKVKLRRRHRPGSRAARASLTEGSVLAGMPEDSHAGGVGRKRLLRVVLNPHDRRKPGPDSDTSACSAGPKDEGIPREHRVRPDALGLDPRRLERLRAGSGP